MSNRGALLERPTGSRERSNAKKTSAKAPSKGRAKAKTSNSGINTSSSVKRGRIDVRTTQEQKEIIELAASLCGESKTSFVLRAVLELAQQRIQELSQTTTTVAGWRRFWEIVSDQKVSPNEALVRAAKRHGKKVVSR